MGKEPGRCMGNQQVPGARLTVCTRFSFAPNPAESTHYPPNPSEQNKVAVFGDISACTVQSYCLAAYSEFFVACLLAGWARAYCMAAPVPKQSAPPLLLLPAKQKCNQPLASRLLNVLVLLRAADHNGGWNATNPDALHQNNGL